MLNTAKAHFDTDLTRAKNLLALARAMPVPLNPNSEREDVFRAAWMMAVGACDSYFSDAYAGLISRAIRAVEFQPSAQISERVKNLIMPVAAVLDPAASGWRWRLAARDLIQNENVLSLEKILKLFNQFCRNNHKLLNRGALDHWILGPQSKQRLFGITRTQYRALTTPAAKDNARKRAITKLEERFASIFQRRHDCIRNCGRPVQALQTITDVHVSKVIADIEFLVTHCHTDLAAEFPLYLKGLGFTGATRNRVGA